MAEIRKLENNYPKDYRTAFEDLATLIFCVELGLSHGVNRTKNHKGLESEPIKIGSKVYAYQAKYYDAASKMSEKKESFISSIREARQQGVTNLLFFVNKNHTEDSKTGGKASYLKEIESVAQGTENESVVKLDWWTLSRIETTLDMEKFHNIKSIYLDGGNANSRNSAFYNYIYDQFTDDSESELYGGMSLQESYIEPSLTVVGNNAMYPLSAKSFLEKFVNDKDAIAVICGEPGHGKTSLCRKSMCDFSKTGWLVGRVTNVFCFSLNPANTNAISSNSLYLYDLLSWGDDRKEQKIKKEDCQNSLIFFDGFDELVEWYPKINIKDFLKQYIIPFQKSTKSHVIITSRTMAIEPIENIRTCINGIFISTYKIQPIKFSQQINWIKLYIKHCNELSMGVEEELNKYLKQYTDMIYNDSSNTESLTSILGIPIIFRMIVTNRYLPSKYQSITTIYDDLFNITWDRHRKKDGSDISVTKYNLMNHALQIFLDNNDTAVPCFSGQSSWLFSFYTTQDGKKRVGFLHRSFYQYFLAHIIFSWYEEYGRYTDTEKFRDNLSYLSRRKIDKTTLSFIKDLYLQKEDAEALGISFEKAYSILKKTDGFLPLPNTKTDIDKMQSVTQLDRATNCFWNIVSIGCCCNHEVTKENVHPKGVRLYELEECILSNAKLNKENFSRALLCGADLHEADLQDTDFCGADLSRANLFKANLSHSNLNSALLVETNLNESVFCNSNLNKADLSRASLIRANFSGANLVEADLRRANLQQVILCETDLSGAILIEADISEASFCRTNLRSADLRRANLKGTDLRKAVFHETDFSEADLRGASFREANLYGVNFSGANLYGADFCNADLNTANLNNASLLNATIDYNNARLLKKRGYSISEMIIR